MYLPLQWPSLIPGHAHPPAMHVPLPHMLPVTLTLTTHAPRATHPPLPYMSSATHALATHTPSHNAPHHACYLCEQTDNCENITLAN